MANLKDLKIRISSVKSTQKITKAMQMVAAAKLKRAQDRASAAAPYADRMQNMLRSLAKSAISGDSAPELITGRQAENPTELLVVVSSDRGLCGGLNTNLLKIMHKHISKLENESSNVKIFVFGKKAYDILSITHKEKIIGYVEGLSKKPVEYSDIETVTSQITKLFGDREFDKCTIVYNKFESVISQVPTLQQIIPLAVEDTSDEKVLDSLYEFEPSETEILEDLLPRNITVQLLHAILENSASEQGARMTAMDNATRNAGEMIKGLTLEYNRTRQAAITTELIEIISGAEAL